MVHSDMAAPISAAAKSLHEQAIEAIVLATKCAYENDQDRIKMYVQDAKRLAELMGRKMRMMGMHRQADEYIQGLNEHINRVWAIAQIKYQDTERTRIERAKDSVFKIRKGEKICKCGNKNCDCECGGVEKSCKCSSAKDKKLEKGFATPFTGESPARKEYMKTGMVQPTWNVTHVKENPKQSYKMLHELSSSQQKDVEKKFPQGNHSHYAYPVHKETGELQHGQRIPLPPGYAIKAHARAFRELKPEHKKGSFVQIDAPGHAFHGKKGIVHGVDPNMLGKVKVQVGPTPNHSIFVEPHQVKMSRAESRVEKAMQTIFNVRKAFMKSEEQENDINKAVDKAQVAHENKVKTIA